MTNWIKCSERLPEFGERVLAIFPMTDSRLEITTYKPSSIWQTEHWLDDEGRKFGYVPTHWQPLPEPPKEDEE